MCGCLEVHRESRQQGARARIDLVHKIHAFFLLLFSFFFCFPPAVCAWEILTRAEKLPYHDLTTYNSLMARVGGGSRVLSLPAYVPERLASLLKSCWNYEMKHRPTMQQIVAQLRQMIAEMEAVRIQVERARRAAAAEQEQSSKTGDETLDDGEHGYSRVNATPMSNRSTAAAKPFSFDAVGTTMNALVPRSKATASPAAAAAAATPGSPAPSSSLALRSSNATHTSGSVSLTSFEPSRDGSSIFVDNQTTQVNVSGSKGGPMSKRITHSQELSQHATPSPPGGDKPSAFTPASSSAASSKSSASSPFDSFEPGFASQYHHSASNPSPLMFSPQQQQQQQKASYPLSFASNQGYASQSGYAPSASFASQQGYAPNAASFVSQSGYAPNAAASSSLLQSHVYKREGIVQQASALDPQHREHYSESYSVLRAGSTVDAAGSASDSPLSVHQPAPPAVQGSSSFRQKVHSMQQKTVGMMHDLRAFLTPGIDNANGNGKPPATVPEPQENEERVAASPPSASSDTAPSPPARQTVQSSSTPLPHSGTGTSASDEAVARAKRIADAEWKRQSDQEELLQAPQSVSLKEEEAPQTEQQQLPAMEVQAHAAKTTEQLEAEARMQRVNALMFGAALVLPPQNASQ